MNVVVDTIKRWYEQYSSSAVLGTQHRLVPEPLESRTLLSASVGAQSTVTLTPSSGHQIVVSRLSHKSKAGAIHRHKPALNRKGDSPAMHPTFVVTTAANGQAAYPYNPTPTVSTLSPSKVDQAYGFNFALPNGSSATGAGETIGIVDAYDDPNIQNDLHVFDQQYFGGVDPSFTQVNLGKSGNTDPSGSWETEESLDVEWAHAIAPQAKIILVEAATNSSANLTTAVDKAVALGANVVSMSWEGGENSTETTYDSHFNVPNVTFVASSGDGGSPAMYPSASPYVLAVGGTSLTLDVNNNISTEVGWSGSGGGISAYENRPAAQPTTYTNGTTTGVALSKRGTPDVAYDANPYTGFAVYDSYTANGWESVGGTSAGAPQWAAIIALADQVRSSYGAAPLRTSAVMAALYADPAAFNDIVSGTTTGTPNYSAGQGYDLVTGLGSPQVSSVVSALVGSINTAPATPPGLWAIPGDGQVNLNWNGSIGATSYNVYRSTDGLTYVLDATVSGTSFAHTGLTDGISYSYEVSAVNAIGESPASVIVAATPQTPPAAPSQLNAAPSSTTAAVTLQWSASTGAATYAIKRSLASGGPWVLVYDNITGTTFTDTDVPTSGGTYYYVISAVTASGQQSANSAQVSATILPAAPTGLTATAGRSQVALAWSASNGATSYDILRSTTSGSGYIVVATAITGTSFTDTNLTNGTAYYYVIDAVNATGASPNSNQANATPSKSGK